MVRDLYGIAILAIMDATSILSWSVYGLLQVCATRGTSKAIEIKNGICSKKGLLLDVQNVSSVVEF